MAANDYFVLGEEKPLDGEMIPWPGGVRDMKEKYEEFIRVRIRELDSKIEEGVMSAVKEIGVDVDKDELIKALQYDRDQFRKGYKAGIEAAQMAWHDAKKELPADPDVLVLVIVDGVFHKKGFIDAYQLATYCGEWIIEGYEEWGNPNVKYWAGLPEPPRGGEEMNDRDRLARLLEAAILAELTVKTEPKGADYIADYLLAHGVTLEEEKRETSLDGKCGSCKWAEVVEAFGGSKCYVRCKNENAQCNRRKRNDLTPVRQRTYPACKLYERREG